MEEIVLKTNALVKKYGRFVALDNVSVEIKKGHIYGFMGQNGAGKSTFMKAVAGLTVPSSGEISLFGKSDVTGLSEARKKLGVMIEQPALFPNYRVKRNVEMRRILSGNPDKSMTDQMVELVGLSDVADKKAKKLSMGMKQRLGIAMALVGNPKLLILDEPVNGLDPENIIALRKLLQKLSEEKEITIFISSHILSELYLLATDYIMIHQGRIIETLSHEQLEEKCKKYICVKTDQVSVALTHLDKLMSSEYYKVVSDDTIRVFKDSSEAENISKLFSENGIVLKELSFKEQSLEEYFMSVIGGAK
ncbi:MAG: ABC transporter ATP-binding protein [Eubacteriales bacterium]|nr:ABC transporter ATP-binding protein [Eubacteriales bacterium]